MTKQKIKAFKRLTQDQTRSSGDMTSSFCNEASFFAAYETISIFKKKRAKMKNKTSKQDFKYCYDTRQQTAIEQHEIMLVAIYNHFRDEIIKKDMEVKSYENKISELNTIEIHISMRMNSKVVATQLDAMNTTAYYALQPKLRGDFFEMMSKETAA